MFARELRGRVAERRADSDSARNRRAWDATSDADQGRHGAQLAANPGSSTARRRLRRFPMRVSTSCFAIMERSASAHRKRPSRKRRASCGRSRI